MAGAISNSASSTELAAGVIPEAQRLGRGSLTMAWWGICSAMFYLVVAAALAMGYGTLNALIGLLLSVLSYGAINAVISRYAIASGLSVALFSQVLFGKAGAALATLIFCATAVYYSVFEGSVMAVALQHSFPALGTHASALVVVVYSVLMIFGNAMRRLDKLNGLLLPLYLIGLFALVGMSIAEYGYSTAWLELAPPGGPVAHGWWHCFTYFMGVWVLMMYTWDYARYGRPEDSDYHARVNFGIPFYMVTFLLNGTVGIFLAATIPSDGGLSEVSVVLAILKLMGLGGLLFVWITQTRINTGNFFLAATNMQAFFGRLGLRRVPYAAWALLTGTLVYLLMLLDVFGYILQALSYQSIFIVSWVAIALAEIRRTRSQPGRHPAQLPAFNARGLLTWFLSAAVGIALLGHTELSTFSAPASFCLAFLGYLWAPSLARRPLAESDIG